jgi:RNA-directed DNA polymerase
LSPAATDGRHCFARYADDANVYVRSHRGRAGDGTAATPVWATAPECQRGQKRSGGRKFLGYSLWVAAGGVVKRNVVAKPLLSFKHRIRELTRRSDGRSIKDVVERLRSYVQGWKAYFPLAQTPRIWRELDEWLRHRLRAIRLKHWCRGTIIYWELGASRAVAQQAVAKR